MLTKLNKLVLPALLFSQLVVANEPTWPENFEASYNKLSEGHDYGCYNNYDTFSISLDLINKTYTKINNICHYGDRRLYGERGQLRIENDQVRKTITELGHPDLENFLNIQWYVTDPKESGYLIYNLETKRFYEYDNDGNLLVQW